MSALNLLFVMLFVLALAYLVMGLLAYSHTITENKGDKWLAISPWWAVYDHLYDDFGRTLSKYGKVILAIEVAGFALWVLFSPT